MFPEHLSLSNIQRGIKTGKYLQGSFMASRENYLEANVSVHDQDRMVWQKKNTKIQQVVLITPKENYLAM